MNRVIISRAPLQFSPRFSLFHFASPLSPNTQSFVNSPLRRNASYNPNIPPFCIAEPSDSLGYGGWGDPQLGGDSVLSGESTQLQKILTSLGINDKKYIFVYLVGFFCALAFTRIRVSSIVAIPACVVVFAVGFSIGYFNGGHLSFSGTKKMPKDEVFIGFVEKLRNLVDFLGGIDSNVVNLKNGFEKNIEKNRITVNDLEGVVKTAKSIDSTILDAKAIIEGLVESIVTETQGVDEKVNRKPSKRRKEVGEKKGFDLFRFFLGMYQENSSGPNGSKVKDLGNKGLENAGVYDDGKQKNIFVSGVEEQIPSTVLNRGGESRGNSLSGRESNMAAITWDDSENLTSNGRRMDVLPEHWSMAGGHDVSDAAFGGKDIRYRYNQYLNRQTSLEMNYPNAVGTWDARVPDSTDFTVRPRHTESDISFRQESEVRGWKEKYLHPDHVEKDKTESTRASVREDGKIHGEEPSPTNQESGQDSEVGSPSPSIIREDTEFNRYLKEASMLLKEAKEVIVLQTNDGHVENALYQSTILLSKAIDIRPMSLLAVGQLGNAYLLHGELKLKTSRQLRATIAGKDPRSDKWGLNNGFGDQLETKDELISTLVNVCEEGEELLIKAGSTYRLALSIDGNDMRALYNWGLALSFRAQLIADIGPGAADDADKMFLAAIDKFDAMLSKSNVYAPDALFRWGAALQQRSRLRRRNSKEKVKLLQQARRFYEDALDMDSDNLQVEAALSSCISELKFWYR